MTTRKPTPSLTLAVALNHARKELAATDQEAA